MQSFCWKHKQAQMSPESGKDYYGFRVDTPKRRYYLRFLPLRGNYNFYIYCYQTDKLERMEVPDTSLFLGAAGEGQQFLILVKPLERIGFSAHGAAPASCWRREISPPWLFSRISAIMGPRCGKQFASLLLQSGGRKTAASVSLQDTVIVGGAWKHGFTTPLSNAADR